MHVVSIRMGDFLGDSVLLFLAKKAGIDGSFQLIAVQLYIY
jgi:hypothetical protein